jgi:hypothetical protein
MPVNIRVSTGRIEVKLTNTSERTGDERTRGPRYEYIDRREALALIKQLAGALERLDNA